MSVTFSGAFTFTGGGFTASLAPPAVPAATAGWFGGGVVALNGARTSIITRITYATDTATSTNRGNLSIAKSKFGSTGTSTQGWWAGGYMGSSGVGSSAVDRTTYSTDTAIASVRGPLTSARYYSFAATGTITEGWFGGGGTPSNGATSGVQRITYATDTDTASVRGPLSVGRAENLAATSDVTTYGWFGGGYVPGSNRTSLIDRITFATDTATASVRGPMSVGRSALAASTDNSTYGWFSGGFGFPYNLPNYSITTVDRITYATDTVTAGVRGGLNQPVLDHGGTSGIQ